VSEGEDREERSEVDASAEKHVPPKAERKPGIRGTLGTFLELVKFEHSIFALPYAYIGALYAAAVAYTLPWIPPWRGTVAIAYHLPFTSRWIRYVVIRGRIVELPSLHAILWITVAMVGARSFAFVINRAVDAEIDARNPRTAGRAIPAGLVKAWELWAFSLVVLAAFLFAVWQLQPITRLLWPIVLAAFLVYPYLKRFTWLCHYWLGICLGLAPVGAWVAITGDLSHPAPWVFGLAVTLWTAGFDIIYALQDIDCDVRDGLHSVPVDFGVGPALLQAKVVHALTWLLLLLGGYLVGAGWPYYLGVVLAGVLLGYENAIISEFDFSRVNAAFFTTNGVIAMVVFAGALADRLLG
jgi:4-hydroxybenzoate polyprenyltransferase